MSKSRISEHKKSKHHKSEKKSEDYIDEKKLPKIIVNRDRQLTIYTWGNHIRNTAPKQTQQNFNARQIDRNKNGVKVNHRDGRVPAIQKMIVNGKGFKKFMEEVLNSIEKFNLTNIGIYCAKGRHRSVSCAELLKKYYYPRAKVYHSELP